MSDLAPWAAGWASWPALVTILGMAVVTYGLRAGGLLLADRLPREGRWARVLERLPGMVLVSIVAPAVVQLGAVGFAAAGVAAGLSIATRSLLAAILGGAAVVALARHFGF